MPVSHNLLRCNGVNAKQFLRRGSAQRLPPGGSCHGVAPKSRPMTDEECGRQCSDLGNVKTYTEGAVLVVTPLEVCDIVPACRFPPEFLSRPYG